MLPKGTAFFSASFKSAMDLSCSGPHSNGVSFLSNWFKGPANLAKSLMNTLQTPTVPKNILTSLTVLQSGHLSITPTLSVDGILPSMVHRGQTPVISSAHRNSFE